MISTVIMNQAVALSAYRDNVELILFGVAKIVMILLGLFVSTIGADEIFCGRKLAIFNRKIYSRSRSVFFGIIHQSLLIPFRPQQFSACSCNILFNSRPSLFAVFVFFPALRNFIFVSSFVFHPAAPCARFTKILITVSPQNISMKLAVRLYGLAVPASFARLIHSISNKIHPSIVQLSRLPHGAVNNQRVQWDYKAKTVQSNLDNFNYNMGRAF